MSVQCVVYVPGRHDEREGTKPAEAGRGTGKGGEIGREKGGRENTRRNEREFKKD